MQTINRPLFRIRLVRVVNGFLGADVSAFLHNIETRSCNNDNNILAQYQKLFPFFLKEFAWDDRTINNYTYYTEHKKALVVHRSRV